jgi:hypothetical protein
VTLAAVAVTAQSAQLTLDEAQAQVIEQVNHPRRRSAIDGAALPGQMLLTRTSRAAIDLSRSPMRRRRIVTPLSGSKCAWWRENVTVAPRDTPQPTQMEEELVVVKRGQTLADALDSVGVPRPRRRGRRLQNKRGETVREGQRVKLLFADFDGSGKNMQLARMSVYNDETIESVVAATDRGVSYAGADGAATSLPTMAGRSRTMRSRKTRRDAPYYDPLRKPPQAADSTADHQGSCGFSQMTPICSAASPAAIRSTSSTTKRRTARACGRDALLCVADDP